MASPVARKGAPESPYLVRWCIIGVSFLGGKDARGGVATPPRGGAAGTVDLLEHPFEEGLVMQSGSPHPFVPSE